eukprot:772921-Lingulodinium_polyedra.AAC.1
MMHRTICGPNGASCTAWPIRQARLAGATWYTSQGRPSAPGALPPGSSTRPKARLQRGRAPATA